MASEAPQPFAKRFLCSRSTCHFPRLRALPLLWPSPSPLFTHSTAAALTGTPSQVARVAKRFRVYFAEVDRNEEDDDYLGE